ncbi:zinc dependent phospholipase C family protein [Clostridium sporogenes]|uniref:zinc dependent phospholipase C family protein n=1 Tax=Clostridium sporogenes TaxID=1509 RepID=UPI00223877B4|nr:zinc dependent phospholipase C family protein [Clostridium sporogenes]EKS4342841.1 zinc dependent phospholipase C family protein [Clostridium botulinum]EKS4393305.1 zinc dependent phospholipase C family protein [Clostridium botulinum]MCW6079172.1 zinc dependent phospholipase C family protein [Clostridium sporogenes]
MIKKLEKTYGSALKGVFFAVNPLKKKMLKTNCTVHKYINIKAVDLLKVENCEKEYEFFKKYIKHINNGVSWADQDFKSSNHFYHVSKGKGLYGFSDALTECRKYYKNAKESFNKGNIEKSLFYLGAACHLIQDATVPQHVNNKLLKSHRKFELWIISKLMTDYSFDAEEGIIKYDELQDFIVNNAIMANDTYLRSINIKNTDKRYAKIATTIIHEAQKTTAGFLLLFYEEMKVKNKILL